MKKISLVLFLCIIAFSILRAEDKSVIKLIPVYEKTFQDTIVDVIFDTATVNIEEAKRRIGKGVIPFFCVLITKEKISFFNKEGKEKRNIKRIVEGVKWESKEGIHIGQGRINVRKSRNGEYLALAIPREGSSLGEGEKGDLVIYRKDGKEMWRVVNVYLSDGIITPSPNGEYALSLLPDEYAIGDMLYYSKNGIRELKSVEINRNKKNYNTFTNFDFFYNGEYFISTCNSVYDDNDCKIIIYDSNGNIVSIKKTNKKIYNIKSINNNYIVLSMKDKNSTKLQLALVNKTGKIKNYNNILLPFAEYSYYLQDGNNLIISFGIKGRKKIYHNYLYRANISSEKCELLYNGKDSERFNKIIKYADDNVILCSNSKLYTFNLYNRNMNIIKLFKRNLKSSIINSLDNMIIIRINNNIKFFRYKGEL
jgi:hypothetical protein